MRKYLVVPAIALAFAAAHPRSPSTICGKATA